MRVKLNFLSEQVERRFETKQVDIFINMDESFSLDDLDRLEIEDVTQFPNKDNITVCSCNGLCLKDKGRNACPCKSIGQYCTSACHDQGENLCMNARRYLESDSEKSSESDLRIESSVSLIKLFFPNLFRGFFDL